MRQTRDLGYIDVNVQVGPITGGARGAPIDLVRRERESHGIRSSLVRHRTALLADAELGNRLLLDEVSDDPRLSRSPCCLSSDRER